MLFQFLQLEEGHTHTHTEQFMKFRAAYEADFASLYKKGTEMYTNQAVQLGMYMYVHVSVFNSVCNCVCVSWD